MKPWIVANWKMNGTAEQVRAASEVWQKANTSYNVVFCPPACWAHLVLPRQPHFYLGGQTCHSAASGAYTGHISASMLKELGCSHVLVGHSEQRNSGQQPRDVQDALIQAHQNALTPIWCIGHRPPPLPSFDIVDECEHISRIIEEELPPFKELMIAYEPIAAIGTGKPLSPTHAATIVQHIKTQCDVPVLYGGSVNTQNIHSFLDVADGVLIGGMSLNIDGMAKLLHEHS